MRSFEAHVKEFDTVFHKPWPKGGGIGKTKWVTIKLQVTVRNERQANSIRSRLRRHMEQTVRTLLPVGGGCRMGEECDEHFCTHGREAELLRSEIQKVINQGGNGTDGAITQHDLIELLDRVDACDSLAYLEKNPPKKGKR